jgi:hypothetical protein
MDHGRGWRVNQLACEQTMTGASSGELATREYEKDLMLAEERGDPETLKTICYHSVPSMIRTRQDKCHNIVLRVDEEYLALDPKNLRILDIPNCNAMTTSRVQLHRS